MSGLSRKRAEVRSSSHRQTPDPLAARIGARIRELRRQSDYSFDAFVEETGLGRGYISELERGLIVPTVGSLTRVAAALEVTLADLVAGESERETLFVSLRDASPSTIRELRDRVANEAAETGKRRKRP